MHATIQIPVFFGALVVATHCRAAAFDINRRPHTTGATDKRLSVRGETFATSQADVSARILCEAQIYRCGAAGISHDRVGIDCTGAASC
ncbi:hypothetical protein [Xanthomonas phaseoli]|uniref:hypothetical protein n=1 Tax=Xanthomonas phaseoli TaxID=1985254 RepID=UPI000A5D3F6F|nr:hypothetical protein [Xanthomonas phaseoli]